MKPSTFLIYISLSKIFVCLFFLNSGCFGKDIPKVWNLTHANSFFVGREEELNDIRSFFKKGYILALTGGPGFGKTQIAKQYAQKFQREYQLVWWVDAQQDIPSQFAKLALALNHILPEHEQINPSALSKDALIERVKEILRIKNSKFLLVFDNAETYDQVDKYIPSVSQQLGKHVLLTSRYANIWTDRIEVGKFKRQESIVLIKKTLPKEDYKEIENLAESLSDYPLGLTLAVGFIKSSPTTTINKYLSMHMKRTLQNSEDLPSTLLDRYSHDAQAALEISLKAIKSKSQEALDVLFFMSLLNSKSIPETYIEKWLQHSKSTLTADEAIKYIYEQSLIDVSEISNLQINGNLKEQDRMHHLSIHDLIHQLINEKISADDKKKLIDKATDVMLEIFSGSSEIFIKKVMNEPTHLLHAQKLCENARKIGYTSSRLLQLKICIFECLMGPTRKFEDAKPLLEEIEKELKFGSVLEPYYEALFKINKGFFECIYTVDYDEAIRYMTEGLAILISLKDYNEEILRAITNLAQYHALRGEIKKAKQIIDEGQSFFKKSKSSAYNSFYLYIYSFILNDQGKFKESHDILDKATIYPDLSIEYPTLHHSILHQRVETFIKQRQLKEALHALKRYKEKITEFYQERSYKSLGSYFVFKSMILIEQKKVSQKIFQNLLEVLKVYSEILHGDKKHRYQARAHLVLGKAYAMKGDLEKALREYLLSEEIYDLIMKEKKIDDISDLYQELAMLGVDLKDEELTNKYLKAHAKIFGLDHPRTKEIFHFLDKRNLAPN